MSRDCSINAGSLSEFNVVLPKTLFVSQRLCTVSCFCVQHCNGFNICVYQWDTSIMGFFSCCTNFVKTTEEKEIIFKKIIIVPATKTHTLVRTNTIAPCKQVARCIISVRVLVVLLFRTDLYSIEVFARIHARTNVNLPPLRLENPWRLDTKGCSGAQIHTTYGVWSQVVRRTMWCSPKRAKDNGRDARQ